METSVNISIETKPFEISVINNSDRFIVSTETKWCNNKKSKYIESLLLGVPSNSMYATSNTQSIYNIEDGNERITAIREFINNKFELTNLQFLSNIEKVNYTNLPNIFKNKLNHTLIPFIIINPNTSIEIKNSIITAIK